MSNYLVPSVVSDTERREMSRLMDIMNGGSSAQPPAILEGSYRQSHNTQQQRTAQPIYETYDVYSPTVSQRDVQEMASILERLQSVTNDTVQELVEEAITDPAVRRAIVTEATDSGVRIGEWEIRVRMDESNRKPTKLYSVVQSGTNNVLAEDLMLFDAADLLVKHFNNGKTVTHQDVRRVLSLEEKFSRNYADAIRFKKHAASHSASGDRHAAGVFEARYDQAKSEAVQAQSELKKLNRQTY